MDLDNRMSTRGMFLEARRAWLPLHSTSCCNTSRTSLSLLVHSVLENLFSLYYQRSPLEYTFFRPFPRLVFGCINADFCVEGRIFQRFSSSTFFPLHHSRFLCFFRTFAPFFTEFDAIFAELQEIQHILQIFIKISPNFFRISQNFSDFERSDVKTMIFHKNLRKIAEIIKKCCFF